MAREAAPFIKRHFFALCVSRRSGASDALVASASGGQQMIDARALTVALGGRWYGRYGAAPCPCCQLERRRDQAALSIANGDGHRLLLRCFKAGCGFADILAAAGIGLGDYWPPDLVEVARREADRRTEIRRRARQAQEVWDEARPIMGTRAEAYLRRRSITCTLPPTLRFAPSCWHPTGKRFPALVALLEGGEGFAVHRTYLRPDGAGKAKMDPPKAMLGAAAGGAVRLTGDQGRLVVAEGIETALSLVCGLLDGPATVWAALSTSGMAALRLPDIPGRLTVAADGDAPASRRRTAWPNERTRWAGRWGSPSPLPAPTGTTF